jgi:Flp pilus assembly protein TadD
MPARLALGIAIAALYFASSWHELGYWDSDRTLWARVVEISPSHVVGRVQAASGYVIDGDLPRALAEVDEGFRYHPNSPRLWFARADFLMAAGRLDEARLAYHHALRSTEPEPGVPLQGVLLSTRYSAAYQLARLEITAKNFPAAESAIHMALAIHPDGSGCHMLLAASLRGQGKEAEARAEEALELHLRLTQQKH